MIKLPSYEETAARYEAARREGNLPIVHYLEVNKGSLKNPRWIRHSQYPTRHDAEQAMFRETLDIPSNKKRVSNADGSRTVIIAQYADDPKDLDSD